MLFKAQNTAQLVVRLKPTRLIKKRKKRQREEKLKEKKDKKSEETID